MRGLGPCRENRAQAGSAQPVVLGAALRLHASPIAGGQTGSGNGTGRRRGGAPLDRRGRPHPRLPLALLAEEEGLITTDDHLVILVSGTRGELCPSTRP